MLLEISNLTKYFGGLCVLMDVSFYIKEREIVGLIGPNGAGKSTIFNVINGICRPDAGSIRFQGKNLIGVNSHRICRSGISRTFQLVRIFPTMTVLENVLVGAVYGNKGSKKNAFNNALECLEILNLVHLKDDISASLTYSDRRLVEIARTIAAKPALALLDEPLAGLNAAETEKMMDVIRDIRDNRAISILWIEHKTDAIFSVCDRIIVLDYGIKLAEGSPKEIVNDHRVVEAYLGESVD